MRRCWLLLLVGSAVGGAEQDWPVRYRWTAGEALTYETRTTISGRLTLKTGTAAPRVLPVGLEVTERVGWLVAATRDDGGAVLQVALTALTVATTGVGGGQQFRLALTPQTARVQQGERVWELARPAAGQALPTEPLFGEFRPADALALGQPLKLTVSQGGQVLSREGKGWRERLAGVPVVGPYAPLLQPFGEVLPELPGKPLPAGQEWAQDRQVPLPGSAETYPLVLHFLLGGAETIGPYDTVRIEFEADARTGDRPLQFALAPGAPVALNLSSLTHEVRGRLSLDPQRGRLVEQTFRALVRSTAESTELQVEADLDLRATMLLLSAESDPAPAAG
ncbi:MAG: hypothetical protein IT204_24995 [Fimbriimonadaceae bacterium]|nr:hypothetical protein [Fimbriimonadaceae bacterium]